MKTIGLWAINGVGLGHTSRQSLVADALKKAGAAVKFLVEHDQQEYFLKNEGHCDPILVCERPWKLSGLERSIAEKHVRSYLSDLTHLIADMGSIPRRTYLRSSVPREVRSYFLLRWMSKERWEPIERAIHDDPSVRAIIVVPRTLFESITGINTGSNIFANQVRFIDGFVLPQKYLTSNRKEAAKIFRVAFCCGSGGVHSHKGYEEFTEVLLGLSKFKYHLGNELRVDAWVGSNSVVRKMCETHGTLFESVLGVKTTTRPYWDDYDIVIGRCGYNTLIEVMQTSSTFVTGPFESDKEWDLVSLRRLCIFGVEVFPTICSDEVCSALLRASLIAKRPTFETNRKTSFCDGTQHLLSHILDW